MHNRQTPIPDTEVSPNGERPGPTEEQPDTFGIYSTLAGKMARLEELLGAIDRLLGQPGLEDRVRNHAEEFHKLLGECRGLYPQELLPADQPKFDRAVDETLKTSQQLRHAIHSNDLETARQSIHQIIQQRQQAHTRFSG